MTLLRRLNWSLHCLILLINYFLTSAESVYSCGAQCSVMTSYNGTESSGGYIKGKSGALRRETCKLYSDTVQCVKRHFQLTASGGPIDDFLSLPSCGPDAAHVTLKPYVDQSMRATGTPPIVRLNISLEILNNATSTAAVRMTCLENGPGLTGKEFLCSDQTRPGWDRFYWPCRMFDWTNLVDSFKNSASTSTGNIRLAERQTFSYDCFRAGASMALMTVHLVLYPKACLLTYPYRIPSSDVIDGQHEPQNWVPFVYLDAQDGNGSVTIFYTLPPVTLNIEGLMVEIMDQLSNIDSDRIIIRSENVDLLNLRKRFKKQPQQGWSFFNGLSTSRYLAIVRIKADWCSEKNDCLYTYVPFNLTSDLEPEVTSLASSDGQLPPSFKLALALVGCLLILSTGFFVFYCIKFWRWRRHSTSMHAVSSNLSKTDVIYLSKLIPQDE